MKYELQKIVEKLMDLKLQKTETSMEIFYLEFFFSSYRNFQTIPSVPLRIAFFTEKNSTLAPVPTICLKRSKNPMNILNSGLLVRLRFKNIWFLNTCSTLR